MARENWNFPATVLVQAALERGEGCLAEGGALVVDTGIYTGRSPSDKFIVDDPQVHDTVDWGKVNQPIGREHFNQLLAKMRAHLQDREVFVQDLYAGADPDHRLKVRVVTRHAWHSMFARNMFIRPPLDELADFKPDFTVLQAPELQADPNTDGTRTGTFIVVDFVTRMILIGGTEYGGEIKKSIFGVMNHLLPDHGIMPMHCSANVGEDGQSAIFFGLSGTGKTTLSADPERTLIGDDEHGWGPNGVFNFEGGCYAKAIDLNPEAEPEIYHASLRFGALLENVVTDRLTGKPDFHDGSKTQNTRCSYPLDFIPNASVTGQAPHPKNIVMLTCDAFGVLPPISHLTPEQAMYHFLSGYTAKVAGTERGITEPQATFSACFGAPFMSRHPSVYAKLLGDQMRAHRANCWLINTGWSGGAYGTGTRMKIAYTRAMVHAALNGSLDAVAMQTDPFFGLAVPTACPDIPDEVLLPRNTWSDGAAYDAMAAKLAGLFEANFRQYESHVDSTIRDVSIRAAA
ncbi:MAG: phosphoenolpyruvate carboxykinase [Geminicoccaceae bacterium]